MMINNPTEDLNEQLRKTANEVVNEKTFSKTDKIIMLEMWMIKLKDIVSESLVEDPDDLKTISYLEGLLIGLKA